MTQCFQYLAGNSKNVHFPTLPPPHINYNSMVRRFTQETKYQGLHTIKFFDVSKSRDSYICFFRGAFLSTVFLSSYFI